MLRDLELMQTDREFIHQGKKREIMQRLRSYADR